jgi:phosphoglucomutase
LSEIYKKHGIYLNRVESVAFEGADGKDKMTRIMAKLRERPPENLGGAKVAYANDSEKGINLPKADVMEFGLENRCSVIIRPSGTEPYIKIYYSIVAATREEAERLAGLYANECRRLLQ